MAAGAVGSATSFHPCAGGGVLFDQARGRLFALNAAAGLAWLCLRDGLSETESVSAIAAAFGIDSATAAAWLRTSTATFTDLRLFDHADPSPEAPAEPLASLEPAVPLHPQGPAADYGLFDRTFRISAPAAIVPAVESLLSSLRLDGATPLPRDRPVTVVDILLHRERGYLSIDGRIAVACEPAAIVAELEQALVKQAVPATAQLLTLHAAVLERDGHWLLLSGVSKSGKTTLSLALARAGWRFGSDELVLLGRDRSLTPLPLPPCIKSDAFPLVETWFPELRNALTHERLGFTVRYLPIRSAPVTAARGHIVFARFDPEGSNALESLDPFGALERLLAQCVFVPPGFRDTDVTRLLDWHAEQSYYALTFRDAAAAVERLAGLPM